MRFRLLEYNRWYNSTRIVNLNILMSKDNRLMSWQFIENYINYLLDIDAIKRVPVSVRLYNNANKPIIEKKLTEDEKSLFKFALNLINKETVAARDIYNMLKNFVERRRAAISNENGLIDYNSCKLINVWKFLIALNELVNQFDKEKSSYKDYFKDFDSAIDAETKRIELEQEAEPELTPEPTPEVITPPKQSKNDIVAQTPSKELPTYEDTRIIIDTSTWDLDKKIEILAQYFNIIYTRKPLATSIDKNNLIKNSSNLQESLNNSLVLTENRSSLDSIKLLITAILNNDKILLTATNKRYLNVIIDIDSLDRISDYINFTLKDSLEKDLLDTFNKVRTYALTDSLKKDLLDTFNKVRTYALKKLNHIDIPEKISDLEDDQIIKILSKIFAKKISINTSLDANNEEEDLDLQDNYDLETNKYDSIEN